MSADTGMTFFLCAACALLAAVVLLLVGARLLTHAPKKLAGDEQKIAGRYLTALPGMLCIAIGLQAVTVVLILLLFVSLASFGC